MPDLRVLGLIGILALLAGSHWLAWQDGHKRAGDAAALVMARYEADLTSQRLRFEQQARETEESHRAWLATVDQLHQEDLKRAKDNADRVVADLRNGNLRLRREWSACETNARVSEATAAVSSANAAAELRAAAAAAIVRVGAECDATIRALQATHARPQE